MQEEIDRESGRTEASDTRKQPVSFTLGSARGALASRLLLTLQGRETKSIWPRSSPHLLAGSLLHRARPELLSFLGKGVLASLLESWPLELSSLDLCLWLWTGKVSRSSVAGGT